MPDAAMSIRVAEPRDTAAIMAFIRELAEYEKLEHEVVATQAQLRESLFGDTPAAGVLIADYEGSPAGFALFFTSFSTFLGRPGIYLEDLFVRKAYRGNGIGKALLAAVARIALERNCGRLEWAVLDWNAPAIGFYERMGAAAMNEWTTYRVTGEALRAMASRTE